MTQVFTGRGQPRAGDGRSRPGPCTVVQAKTPARDGYAAVQLGFGAAKAAARRRRRCAATFAKAGTGRLPRAARVPARRRRRARRSGTSVAVGDVFKAGDRVDVTGITKGRGTAGVMKRHHFSGFPGVARHARVLPARRLDRQPLVPGPRLQGQAHGGPATATSASRRATSRSSRCAPTSICCWCAARSRARAAARSSSARRRRRSGARRRRAMA